MMITNMLDLDTINQDNHVAFRIRQEEMKIKNRILAMPDIKKKQALWSKYFVPLEEPSDDWMLHAKIF